MFQEPGRGSGRGSFLSFAFPPCFRYTSAAFRFQMTIFLLFAAMLTLFTGCDRQEVPRTPPQPAPMQRIPAFDGARAFALLTAQTDFGPRNPNSPGHARCLDFLTHTLTEHADTVRLQPFSHAGYDGEMLALTNVIASFRPEASARILLCAHWDTRPRADRDENRKRRDEPILGANDGASGVAVLLHLASLLRESPPPVGVDIVLFDGEDYGMEGDVPMYLLGSRHYARTSPPRVRFGILLDMVGDSSLDLPREGYSMSIAPDIVNLVWSTARGLGYRQFVDELEDEILDDHVPLNEAGIRTINIIDFNYPDATHRWWHTHEDTPDKCSPQSLEAVGTVITHVIYTQRP